MVNRRTVLAGTTVGVYTLFGGCLNSVTGGFRDSGVSLSGQTRDILNNYEAGIEKSNEGSVAWNSGITLFNDENYNDAVDEFESAVEHFGEAEESFAEAERGARDIGETDAARLIADAIERMSLMGEAASAGLQGAKAGADDEGQSTIAKHIRTAQEKEEEATAIEIREPDVIAATLSDE